MNSIKSYLIFLLVVVNGFFYLNTGCALNNNYLTNTNLERFDYVALSTKLRDGKPIFLNTSIHIEYVHFKFKDGTHAYILAENTDNINNLFKVTIDKFSFANLNFVINRINMIEHVIECDTRDEMNDKFINFMVQKMFDGIDKNLLEISSKNEDTLNIFFCFSIEYGILGISSHPYLYPGSFIFMSKVDNQMITLAHELGHYFGLLHTFQSGGDLCKDTDDKHIDSEDVGTGLDPNCNNIMSYSKPEEPIENLIFTESQKELIITNMFMPSRFKQLKYNDIKLDNVISYDCSNISRLINIEITRIFNGQI